MNKWLKRTLLASVALAAAGAVLMGAGMALGGSPSFYYDADGLHVKENTDGPVRSDYVLERTQTGTLSRLELDLKNADLQIASGEEWTVEYVLDGWYSEPVYSVENGTLTLQEGSYVDRGDYRISFGFGGSDWMYAGEKVARSPYVKITIPENARLDSVNICSGSGKVSIEKNLRADTVSIDTGDGDVRLDGWTGDTLRVENEYGELVAGTLNGEKVNIYGENGPLQIGLLKTDTTVIEAEYGDVDADVDGPQNLEVRSSDGEVRLGLSGTMEDYGVSLYSEYGTIRVPDGGVATPDEDSGGCFYSCLSEDQDAASILVDTEYGDIRIREY